MMLFVAFVVVVVVGRFGLYIRSFQINISVEDWDFGKVIQLALYTFKTRFESTLRRMIQ